MADLRALRAALDAASGRFPVAAGWTIPRVDKIVRARYWRRVRSCRQFIEESEKWPLDRLQEYQLRRLQNVINHAYEHVPYYRRMFDEMNARPGDIRQLADIRLLPPLGKQDLQEQLESLLASDVPARRRKYYTTGGSTGIPVGFFHDRGRTSAYEWAFMSSQWRRVGYRDGDRTAVLRGAVTGKELFSFDALHNALSLSSYHLTDDRMPVYIERLRQFRPKYIQAYPSSITMLARFMRTRNESPIDGVRAILCGSENLYEWQRREIENAFQCRLFSWYGQSEVVCLAGECEHTSLLHIFPQYGLTELIDQDGHPVEQPGQIGEIVGTGFLSRSMPLIRYRTSDVASYASGTCTSCGRPYPLFAKIEGRLQEFIVTGTGRYISMTAINMHSPVFDNVHQFRFYQDTPGTVILRLVPKATYSGADDTRIRAELAPKLGEDLMLTLEQVDKIQPTPRGKHRFLEQKLPTQFGDHTP
jgi:phenylacetate-CoA ligase